MLEKKYPVVEVDLKKLRQNIDEIVRRCKEKGIDVAGVVKGFNGISQTLKLYGELECSYIASSRLEHLENARELGLKGPFLAIRIPMQSEIPDLVRLADISLNSELSVIKTIDKESGRQKKRHGIILMADLGDLREGFWDKAEMLNVAVYIEKELKNVYLAGIGTNLGCYGSINATPDKMKELIAIAETIEEAIGRRLDIISGGGTTSFPLVVNNTMPERINHLRIGEGIALGRDLEDLWNLDMSFLNKDVFTLKAEIIEIKDKPSYPVGEIFVDCFGNRGHYEDRGIRKRAVLAVGKVDFALDSQLEPRLPGIQVLGSSSDHLILDIQDYEDGLAVGDILEFDLRYSTMVFLTNSKYIRIECRE
ncbi:MAG: alanine/ornithine racemase family PLP-dependent enzyme [Eubacteriales bacterium]|nr:alanine/ornithine racemase family PLP-dependent enzyme [Eubacteriales bacterium]MDD4583013.1 alanine/ornithine racemase family PLP-dependent enzyme [Eubacteriales bacterium]